MKTTYKTIIGLAVLALLLVPLGIAMATAIGVPVKTLGYDQTVDFKAAVRFSSFNNDRAPSAFEAILGADGLPTGSATVDFNRGATCSGATPIGSWRSTSLSNHVTFSYDPATGLLHTTVQASYLYCAEYYIGDLGPLNYIRIDVDNLANGTSVAFNNMQIDGIQLGNFVGVNGAPQTWNVFGLTFTDGFTIQGDILLSKAQAGQDTNKVEITVGQYDQLGPVTSNVFVSPLPVHLNGQATIAATVDDTEAYGSYIGYGEFILDDGLWSDWSPMAALDGAYDEVIEDVTADFTAAAPVGKHTTCVRGVDAFWLPNTGQAVCQDFVVTYVYDGFYEPVTNDLINLIKAGQAVPVKWRLTDALGTPIENPSSFVGLFSSPVACDELTEPVDAIEEFASGDSGLQYLGDGYWQFNWKTPKTYAGTCRTAYVKFDSGTTSNIVSFQFK